MAPIWAIDGPGQNQKAPIWALDPSDWMQKTPKQSSISHNAVNKAKYVQKPYVQGPRMTQNQASALMK